MNIQVLDHLSARWTHAFFERHRPLHEAILFFEDLAGRHGSYEKLGLAALDLHHFPDFGDGENWRGIWRVDGVGLGLVKNDHDCGRFTRRCRDTRST